ncbi:MAG: hypothetical protein D6690_02815 [Nitrospirae bacterium]|nr:MAG: hypothetical protein D6690_02815 [Nitrospirota bacterium]
MQIDFHHAVTYVIARLAGLSHPKANVVAYCAQYVDDATNGGTVKFDNGAMYHRISSAHKMLDYRNSKALKNRHVWLPFHFLPGNDGLPAGKAPRGGFHKRLVCRPNSSVAQDMVRACLEDKKKPYGLYRLGVTMHVFADTWAHQGFAGINHKLNEAHDIESEDKQFDARFYEKIANFFISEAFPLGHGAVLSYPDRPYLKWSYTNGLGERIERDNPKDFLEAANEMCKTMRRWQLGDPDAQVDGLPREDEKKIDALLRTTKLESGDERHAVWLKKIAEGHFSFGPTKLTYIPKGKGSWKHQALGTREWVDDPDDEPFHYTPSFLTSHWKMFHDALQAHRFDILHDILPKYGICAA